MDKEWEEKRVRTPEQIFNEIKLEMARPVGIVLFGADCGLKEEVQEEMMNALGGFARYYTKTPDTATIVNALKTYSALAVTLDSDESSMHDLRHELIKVMQNAGAKTVVGIYVKARMPRGVPTRHLSSEAKEARLASERCIVALTDNPPTADGLDCFVEVEEKRRG